MDSIELDNNKNLPKKSDILAVFQTLKEMADNLDKYSEVELNQICAAYGKMYLHFEQALSRRITNNKINSIELKNGLQNRQFMFEILPYFQRWIQTLPLDTRLSAIDIGSSWGLGSNILAILYKRGYLGYKIYVTAFDIRSTYSPYVAAFCPHVNHVIGNIFTLKKTFDVVLCSHVIEHVENPVYFVKRLVEIAKKRVFLAAPYMEEEPLASNHINIFDDKFLGAIGAARIEIVESVAWGLRSLQRKKMFIAKLTGNAQ
jgi:2-polyprenyl-3-methyl-5-hydroxy-6-metoxy-1,4-benzoquinol methylase